MENETIEPRSIDELADLPYSEMTDEEIELFTNWKAANIARDNAHVEAMNALHDRSRELAAIAREEATAAKSALAEMVEQSRILFERATNGTQE